MERMGCNTSDHLGPNDTAVSFSHPLLAESCKSLAATLFADVGDIWWHPRMERGGGSIASLCLRHGRQQGQKLKERIVRVRDRAAALVEARRAGGSCATHRPEWPLLTDGNVDVHMHPTGVAERVDVNTFPGLGKCSGIRLLIRFRRRHLRTCRNCQHCARAHEGTMNFPESECVSIIKQFKIGQHTRVSVATFMRRVNRRSVFTAPNVTSVSQEGMGRDAVPVQ